MCGISGLVDLSGKNAEKSKIEKISSCLNHRGPDGNGLWMLENIALAHTRLAILDLSKSANQPMISKNQMYSLTYNGELYNYQELRKQLKQKGYQFSTNSDSEVILNSLIEWGTDALLKFNGIFAFGFYNNFNKTLLMARDRYGVKPLYYLSTQNYFAFASEQKSLLNVDKFEKNLDLETLYEYMTFQNIFTNNYSQITRLSKI
jgi:asparagine synthase (glutamine-hydrolysing)